MNIFILSNDPATNALYHADRHLVSQTKESLQILGTVVRQHGSVPDDSPVYRATHASHPCVTWAGSSLSNFRFLRALAFSLLLEGEYRYQRVWVNWLRMLADHPEPAGLVDRGLTPFALAMPDELKGEDAVRSYRSYYLMKKTHLMRWTRRAPPRWVPRDLLSSGQKIQRQFVHSVPVQQYDVTDVDTWPERLRKHLL